MRFFVLITLSLMVVVTATTRMSEAPTQQPTAQPYVGAHFGGYCTDEIKCTEGKCIGPKRFISGELHGVCVPLKVGDCKRGCIHDPEGGSLCKFFPGACFKCNKGRPRKGICKKR